MKAITIIERKTELDRAETDLRQQQSGGADLSAMWCLPDQAELATKNRQNRVKAGDHGRSKSRTSSFTNFETELLRRLLKPRHISQLLM